MKKGLGPAYPQMVDQLVDEFIDLGSGVEVTSTNIVPRPAQGMSIRQRFVKAAMEGALVSLEHWDAGMRERDFAKYVIEKADACIEMEEKTREE